MATQPVIKPLLYFVARLCLVHWPLIIVFGWLCTSLVRVGEMVVTNTELQGDYREVLSDCETRATEIYLFQWVTLHLSVFLIRSYDTMILWLIAGTLQLIVYIIIQQDHFEEIELLAIMIFQEWIILVCLLGKLFSSEIYFFRKLAFNVFFQHFDRSLVLSSNSETI